MACGNKEKENISIESSTVLPQEKKEFKVFPIQHATMVLEWNGIMIYVDPVGGASPFQSQKQPDLILITDVHDDHFSLKTLQELNTSRAKIVLPQTVADTIPEEFTPQLDVLDNGDEKERFGITVKAIPKQTTFQCPSKELGNSYILEMNGERIYISGTVKNIPEIRALQNMNKAFIGMGLSKTVKVESLASVILRLHPKEVYLYYYMGAKASGDIQKIKKIVNEQNSSIEVIPLKWYD